MNSLRFDPDLLKVLSALPNTPLPVPRDVFELRATANAALGAGVEAASVPAGIEETTLEFTAKDGTTLPLYRFTPPSAATKTPPGQGRPAVLFVHGGGMVSGSVPLFRPSILNMAAASGVTFYGVGYRLAPEAPFPTPVDDVFAALEWLRAHAADEGVDPARIAICGASAGGGIAAGVALMARDRGLTPPIAKQVLIYPMLDDRTRVEPNNPMTPFLTWNAHNNELGWAAYLGDDRTNVSPYAAPARATDLAGLPRTFIDVGGLDLFRDEDIAYAARLAAANVEVDFHLYPGLPHGWEFMAAEIPVSKRAEQSRVAALIDL